MSQFIVSKETIASVEEKVQAYAPNFNSESRMMAGPRCGCGAGGTCASSCVSGCAERGGYPK